MAGEAEFYCGYCGGDVIWSVENVQYEHADSGERVKADSPGDYVSAAHNRKGTRVNAVDVQRSDERDVDDFCIEYTGLTDQAGYLDCGCHGSQREHTHNEPTSESAIRAEGGQDI